MELEKIYNPQQFEKKIAKKWKDKKIFSKHDDSKKPFTVLLPPPNVTGKLHIGHALDTYIQDTIIRYKKLSGYDTFYIAGMDHAGIATQSKVESTLFEKEGLTRHDLGREQFISRIWEWKEEYAKLFRKQWDYLGLALDYQNERFTLDKKSNKAVVKAFVELYKKGLIYRGTRAINWDPMIKTALSNVEVINKPTEQKMYYIKYPIVDSDEFLTIATVRTETMLSDVAIIYNPNDKRYNKLFNLKVRHPLTNKIIPLIADEYADIKFGSGLMKLSAHAEVDIEIIKKHNLEIIETIDKDGLINCPNSEFHKLTRFEAREQIANFLQKNNLLLKVENVVSNVGYSERSKVPVEILVMPQWFVKMDKLADDILQHLKSNDSVKFYPNRFSKTLKTWMLNVHDWTISRQLWWGHRIPAWYKDNEVKVQESCPGEGWEQDPDVLDTWFSSGLTPFSFLGWPNKNDKLLKRYFPTSLLVTGYDIIFFWVARMYFFGLEFMNKKPFNEVLCHGLLRDANGKKMSKSSNNGVDPIEVIEANGSDALRWFMITNFSPGLDIRYSEEKIKSAWALCNKIWNITRYIQSLPNDNNSINPADIWINNKLVNLKKKIDKSMKNYELTVVGSELSKFIYNDFSSWYIELLKIMPSKKQALNNLKTLLLIAHPFLPFLTDYLFSNLFNEELLENEFPKLKLKNNIQNKDIDNIINITNILRKYRENRKISKKTIIYYDTNIELNDFVISSIEKLAFSQIKANKDLLFVEGDLNVYILEDESTKQDYKLQVKEKIEKLNSEILRAQNMLNNPNFVQKAPDYKVKEERDKLAKFKEELAKYKEEL